MPTPDTAPERFENRPTEFLGLREICGWRLKTWGIRRPDAATLDVSAFDFGCVAASLPQPAQAPGRFGVGFLILHHGRGARYLVLGWWDNHNECPLRVFVHPDGAASGFRPAQGAESFCVWDLEVMGFERNAFVATILGGGSADDYLASVGAASAASRWRNGRLEPAVFPQAVRLDDLIGIDRQKQALVQNTAQFVRGLPANHALLTGARGTGKSSLVKAMLTAFGSAGLRLVEVHPQDLTNLPDIVAPLRDRRERFILYVDDFSVAANDPALVALKTALDGGIEEPPENVLIYATSNRRHLLPEHRTDNEEYHWEDGELHPGESTEEKISLSERFGLWLSFPPFNQDQYVRLVRLHLQALGHERWSAEVEKEALRWGLQRASRSGRVARQFARDFVGRIGTG